MIVWELLTMLGNVFLWIGIALFYLVLSFIVSKKMKKFVILLGFFILSSVAISSLIVYSMKILFKIPRPCLGLPDCPESYSFPSGHATVVFAAIAVLSSHYKDRRITFFLFIIGCLVALSRLMLNLHRMEDLIFGSIIGFVTGILVQKIYINYQKELKNSFQNSND